MKLALKSLRVVAAILPSFPECRRHILRLRNTILAATVLSPVDFRIRICTGFFVQEIPVHNRGCPVLNSKWSEVMLLRPVYVCVEIKAVDLTSVLRTSA